MTEQQTTVPTDWLRRVVTLLNAMAGDGIGMSDCADPQDLMCEIAISMGHGDADDPWSAVTAALGGGEMSMPDPVNQTTPSSRSVQRAAATLRRAGWAVIPPQPRQSTPTLRDQCEFPDMMGAPGDCCTRMDTRNRKTPHGTLWLCTHHFDRPLAELFDLRCEAVP